MSDLAPVVAEALRRVGEFHEIERSVRGLPADERLQARQVRAVRKVVALRAWLERELARLSAKSLTAGAIR